MELTMLEAHTIEKLLTAARTTAEKEGIAVCIGVTDTSGATCGFLKMPGAFLVSSDLAIDKAWSAAGMGMSTRALGDALRTMSDAVRDGLLRRPRLTDVPGGVPIKRGAQCVGAIGVSGGSDQQDEDIALAAIAAIESILNDKR